MSSNLLLWISSKKASVCFIKSSRMTTSRCWFEACSLASRRPGNVNKWHLGLDRKGRAAPDAWQLGWGFRSVCTQYRRRYRTHRGRWRSLVPGLLPNGGMRWYPSACWVSKSPTCASGSRRCAWGCWLSIFGSSCSIHEWSDSSMRSHRPSTPSRRSSISAVHRWWPSGAGVALLSSEYPVVPPWISTGCRFPEARTFSRFAWCLESLYSIHQESYVFRNTISILGDSLRKTRLTR